MSLDAVRPLPFSAVQDFWFISRDAFSAGQMPKNSPTLVATVNPAITDQSGTVEGRLGMKVRMAG